MNKKIWYLYKNKWYLKLKCVIKDAYYPFTRGWCDDLCPCGDSCYCGLEKLNNIHAKH